MTTIYRLLCASALLSLSACTTLPTYEPKPEDVTVQFVGLGRPSMCTAGTSYRLDVLEKDGVRTARVPAGKRVMLWTHMSFDGYQVISSCNPALSFVPEAKQAYVVNAGLSSGQCFIELVREDRSVDTGVKPEPTLGRPAC